MTSYLTNNEAVSYLGVSGVNSGIVDEVVAAVSRLIDNYCGDHFWQTSAGTARIFTPDNTGCRVTFGRFNPLLTLTSIEHDTADDGTYSTTLTSSQYRTFPVNPSAAPEAQPLRGFDTVNLTLSYRVRVTGTWGWSAVPAQVKMACRLQTARVFKRQDTPLGVAGFGELGAMRVPTKLDPDVRHMLDPYRLDGGLVVA